MYLLQKRSRQRQHLLCSQAIQGTQRTRTGTMTRVVQSPDVHTFRLQMGNEVVVLQIQRLIVAWQ